MYYSFFISDLSFLFVTFENMLKPIKFCFTNYSEWLGILIFE